MQKQTWTWTSHRLPAPARLARWGHFGPPVLIFPSAGGDFDEIERFQLLGALGELIERGRMKAYSVDGLSVRASLAGSYRPTGAVAATHASAVAGDPASAYDSFLYEEVLQRIREDCKDPHIEPILAGASRGAHVAIATLCLHPDTFRAAIGMSGVYDLVCLDRLAGQQLEQLRRRTIVLGSGEGDYESPEDSRRLSQILAAKGVACRLSLWGPARAHTWSTWREFLPGLLAEFL